ncbi:transposase [Paraburkholderia caribensis]|uniref:transposase n=1 Tax=Paraburkholderia caribensis TaxID=75105 RepID=UPI0031D097C0
MKRFVEGDDRKQVALLPECVDDYIGQDNPVRVIDAFVDELDLAELGFDGTTRAMTGRPSYHPGVMLKIYIYGYLNRIPSSRRLERECQRNVELMWLTGRLAPDFKTIADFRRNSGAAIRNVCRRFVELCRGLVDWLLKMRRLPEGLMLDRALARGAVRESDIARIVRRLSTFYRALPGAKMSASAYHAHFLSEIARNESVLTRIMTRQSFDIRRLCGIQLAMLTGVLNRLELRVAHGWIRECHGDLRPEHVCLTRPIGIIDCLEFSERLRTIDTLDEVGFLALECERLGAPKIGAVLLDAYAESMHDPVDEGLLHFYQSIRATVRGRPAAAHLLERKIGRVRHWRRRTLAYFELGASHARQCAAALQAGTQALTLDVSPME